MSRNAKRPASRNARIGRMGARTSARNTRRPVIEVARRQDDDGDDNDTDGVVDDDDEDAEEDGMNRSRFSRERRSHVDTWSNPKRWMRLYTYVHIIKQEISHEKTAADRETTPVTTW